MNTVSAASRYAATQLRHGLGEDGAWAEHVAQHPLVVRGSIQEGTNTTLLAEVGGEQVVYKPAQGARPLGDYDVSTLHLNEVAFYELSRALGSRLGLRP